MSTKNPGEKFYQTNSFAYTGSEVNSTADVVMETGRHVPNPISKRICLVKSFAHTGSEENSRYHAM